MNVGALSGLPSGTGSFLEEEGISELYPPQAAAVEAGVLAGENVVASVPTASGKTLIAALGMLSAIERGGKALYIVPLRALASEKHAEFEKYESLGVTVGMSTGNYEATDEWLASKDIIVATSEKVDSLIRNDASWIDDLTCVVADEVHLVDDGSRGPTLEVTLAKLRRKTACQIIALSATIGNADAIAEWLDAELVDSSWRPISLKRGVHYGNAVNFADGSQTEVPVENGNPTEGIVTDTVSDGGSVLVFVNSRRNAEAAARRLSDAVESLLSTEERERVESIAEEIRQVSDTDTSRDLARAVAKGAAFHHAGCMAEHRSLVEDAFRDRDIKVVCATPTLAAGVNTPSRRVVVRDWRRYDASVGGMAPLSTLEVHQMFGRAGRPGYDPYGEAVLLASSHDEYEELFDRYIYGEPEDVRSKLAAEPALRTHVLASVATGFASTREGLVSFLSETLYAIQTVERGRIEGVLDDVIEYLVRNDFIERDGDSVVATSIGHTVSQLYLEPMSAAIIINGLEGVEEASPLGLYQLISRTPDMYELYLRSGDDETYTELAYEHEDEMLGRVPSEFETEWEDWLSALKTGKLLADWASEMDEDKLTNRYGVGPGDIRGKVDTAEWLLSAAERLASECDASCVSAVRTARKRVEHGVSAELLDLVGVRGIGRKRARRLYDAGITTRSELRNADKAVVLRALEGRKKTAENILRNAGREDPSMEDLSPDRSEVVAQSVSEDGSSSEQSGLGDFGS